jgi:2-keto-4-pentenoate hydratase/2-oxohepta-3-ene-1,7-dioic acid hydratase in catechol pathway
VRIFEDQRSFEFANPAAIVGPGAEIERRGAPGDKVSQASLELRPRLAAVIGAGGALAGFTAFADWRHPGFEPPKDRDFALGLGPAVVTADELDPDGIEAVVRVDGVERLRGAFGGFDWKAAREHAAVGTTLRPGDILAGPALGSVDAIEPGRVVELEVAIIGTLEQSTSGGQSPFGDSPP